MVKKPKRVPHTDEEFLHAQGYSMRDDPDIAIMVDNLRICEHDYTDYLAKHKDLLPNAETKVDSLNVTFKKLMMMQLVQPLMRGVSVNSVLESAGMYIGYCFVDKKLAQDVSKELAESVHDGITRMKELPFCKPFRPMMDAVDRALTKGRTPLTADSAATMEIGFLKNAYRKLREPDADKEQILLDYSTAVDVLHRQAMKDGVSHDEIVEQRNCLVGRLIEKYPEDIRYFSELSDSSVVKDEYKKQYLNIGGTMKPFYVWDGTFKTQDGNDFREMFSPRLPETLDYHVAKLKPYYDAKLEEFDNNLDRAEYVAATANEIAHYKTDYLYATSDALQNGCRYLFDDLPPADSARALATMVMRSSDTCEKKHPGFRDILRETIMARYTAYTESYDRAAEGKLQANIIEGSGRREYEYDYAGVSEEVQDKVDLGKMPTPVAKDLQTSVQEDSFVKNKDENIVKPDRVQPKLKFPEWLKEMVDRTAKETVAEKILKEEARRVRATPEKDDDIRFEKKFKPRVKKAIKDKTTDVGEMLDGLEYC